MTKRSVFFLTSALLVFSSYIAIAEPLSSNDDIVNSHIKVLEYITDKTYQVTTPILSELASSDITHMANKEPFTRRDAAIVFDRGQSEAEIRSWIKNNDLQLINLEASFAISSSIFKARLMNIEAYEGTLKQRLQYFAEEHKTAIRQILKNMEQQSKEKDISSEELLQIEAQVKLHNKLLEEPIKYYQAEVIGAYKSLDTIQKSDGVAFTVLQTDSTEQRTQDAANVVKRNITGIDKLLSGEAFENKQTSTVIDLEKDKIAAEAIKSIMQVDAKAAGDFCGPGSPERNCPLDDHFVPKKDTRQSSVIGRYVAEGTEGRKFTKGWYYSTMKWDRSKVFGQYINTAAFKLTAAPHCNPIRVPGRGAPCGGYLPQKNKVYVPSPAYEADGLIDNPQCLTRRTGQPIDRNYNCLLANYALTSLPLAYVDTTFADPADTFSASIGSVGPELISEGSLYYTYIRFWTWEHQYFVGQRARMFGQVSSEFSCCGPTAFRVFAVDTSRALATDTYLPNIIP